MYQARALPDAQLVVAHHPFNAEHPMDRAKRASARGGGMRQHQDGRPPRPGSLPRGGDAERVYREREGPELTLPDRRMSLARTLIPPAAAGMVTLGEPDSNRLTVWLKQWDALRAALGAAA